MRRKWNWIRVFSRGSRDERHLRSEKPHCTGPHSYLQLPRNIAIVNIPHRIPSQPSHELHQVSFTTPGLHNKCPRHIRSIQQGTARPDLAVVGPALGNPIDFWVSVAEISNQRTRSRCCLACEKPGLQSAHEAAADEKEGCAVAIALLEEGDFAESQDVAGFMRAHEDDVERWAGLEVVLLRVSAGYWTW